MLGSLQPGQSERQLRVDHPARPGSARVRRGRHALVREQARAAEARDGHELAACGIQRPRGLRAHPQRQRQLPVLRRLRDER